MEASRLRSRNLSPCLSLTQPSSINLFLIKSFWWIKLTLRGPMIKKYNLAQKLLRKFLLKESPQKLISLRRPQESRHPRVRKGLEAREQGLRPRSVWRNRMRKKPKMKNSWVRWRTTTTIKMNIPRRRETRSLTIKKEGTPHNSILTFASTVERKRVSASYAVGS